MSDMPTSYLVEKSADIERWGRVLAAMAQVDAFAHPVGELRHAAQCIIDEIDRCRTPLDG